MNKIKLKVNYDDFCNWYFDDDADIQADTIDNLIKDGVVSIQCIADRVCYLPLHLIKNQELINKNDITDGYIKEPNRKYKVILLRK